MSGTVWAMLAGLGFGLFQTLNRRAVSRMDVYVATFVQLLISAVVLAVASLATQDLRLLLAAPAGALINFALAGFFHFFVGWTLLNASQKRIGASRTSPLIGTTPLFAAVIAAVTLGEIPSLPELAGIALIVMGVYFVSKPSIETTSVAGQSRSEGAGWRAAWLGLSAAFCWSLSPIFIRAGLAELPSPLLGVTIGLTASALGYGVALLWQHKRWTGTSLMGEAWFFKLAASFLVGLSTWARWVALDLSPVAVVLAISLVSVPLVIFLSPFVSGKQLERVTATLWMGAALIVGGALLLILLN